MRTVTCILLISRELYDDAFFDLDTWVESLRTTAGPFSELSYRDEDGNLVTVPILDSGSATPRWVEEDEALPWLVTGA